MVLTTIGKRRNAIGVQVATTTTDSQGGYTTSWATTATEWGQAIPLSQSRALDLGGMKYRMAVEFTIRKRTGLTITPANRLEWNSEYYTIHSVVPSPKLDDQIIIAYV
jgi:SPP1 family predicted phage head-tail adaptor